MQSTWLLWKKSAFKSRRHGSDLVGAGVSLPDPEARHVVASGLLLLGGVHVVTGCVAHQQCTLLDRVGNLLRNILGPLPSFDDTFAKKGKAIQGAYSAIAGHGWFLWLLHDGWLT